MALIVTLRTNGSSGSYINHRSHNNTVFNNKRSHTSFYDPVTNTSLTAANPNSNDLSSFIGQVMPDGKTPKLYRIGQAIRDGILEVTESDPAFPARALATPMVVSHAMDHIVVPGAGAGCSGKWYRLYWTATGISGVEYNPTTDTELNVWATPMYPKTSGYFLTDG